VTGSPGLAVEDAELTGGLLVNVVVLVGPLPSPGSVTVDPGAVVTESVDTHT
jgi:hypothetical protein